MDKPSILDIVSATEAAEIAGITRGHVWRLCRSGKWPHFIISGKFCVYRGIAERYKREKPGPKLGQKINRRKK